MEPKGECIHAVIQGTLLRDFKSFGNGVCSLNMLHEMERISKKRFRITAPNQRKWSESFPIKYRFPLTAFSSTYMPAVQLSCQTDYIYNGNLWVPQSSWLLMKKQTGQREVEFVMDRSFQQDTRSPPANGSHTGKKR